MARQRGGRHAERTETSVPQARVLVVCADRPRRDRVTDTLARQGIAFRQVASALAARDELGRGAFDLLILDAGSHNDAPLRLAEEIRDRDPAPAVVLLASHATLALATAAMRCGAIDLIEDDADPGETRHRLERALRRGTRARESQQRVARLTRICKHLSHTRQEISTQIGSMCDDLVNAYAEMTDQIDRLAISCEFTSLIRQELDVESLLRTVLEFVLARVGSTNAAIFLPDSSGDYSLGAYVNYDRSGEDAETLLEHMADVLPDRLEEARDVLVMRDRRDIEAALELDAHWLAEQTLAVLPCRSEGECLGLIALYRSDTHPFDDAAITVMQIVAEAFGAQLGRVIRIHHRHQPKNNWSAFEDGDDGIGGLDLAA